MKVYFGTSPHTKDKYPEVIKRIYALIEKLGYEHTSAWVRDVTGEQFYGMTERELEVHQNRTEKEIKKADICVFDVSLRSLSAGFLANFALSSGKIVIILSNKKDNLLIFRIFRSRQMIMAVYNENNLEEILSNVFKVTLNLINKRFNFFITKELLAKLDYVALNQRLNKSEYVRQLIEKDIKKNKRYKESIR